MKQFVFAQPEVNHHKVYYPYKSIHLLGLFGASCEYLKIIRDDILKNESIYGWDLNDNDVEDFVLKSIVMDILQDIKSSINEGNNLKSNLNNNLTRIREYILKTNLMITKISIVLSIMRNDAPKYYTLTDYSYRGFICSFEDVLNENINITKALDAMNEILQSIRNILEKTKNYSFTVNSYRLRRLSAEYREICAAINKECSDTNSNADPSASDSSSPDIANPNTNWDPW